MLEASVYVAFCLLTALYGFDRRMGFVGTFLISLVLTPVAVLAVLLLRGSQTLNEIRLRASSLHPIENLEAAEALLTGLSNRSERRTPVAPTGQSAGTVSDTS